MVIIVNHLTRMKEGYICISGIDMKTFQHVRPISKDGNLPRELMKRYGGPFDIAVSVDLGKTEPNPIPPKVEDHIFNPSEAHALPQNVIATEFWEILEGIAKARLLTIFGKQLKREGAKSCGVEMNQGKASLGCLNVISLR
jgi:hypothetical protein